MSSTNHFIFPVLLPPVGEKKIALDSLAGTVREPSLDTRGRHADSQCPQETKKVAIESSQIPCLFSIP